MKKHIKLLTIGTLLLGGLTGCNDFLHPKVIWLHTQSMLTHLKQ